MPHKQNFLDWIYHSFAWLLGLPIVAGLLDLVDPLTKFGSFILVWGSIYLLYLRIKNAKKKQD